MNPSVLIVDDSLTVRMDLKAAFEFDGYLCTMAETLGEARLALARQRFDLIVLDVLLPDGNGVDLLAELKQAPNTKAIPVIILSTEADISARLRGLKTGADDYVGKPYEKDYLLYRAKELLGGLKKTAPGDSPATLLVIDDSKTYRQWLKEIVEPMGYRVVEAEGGEQGLRLAARTRPVAIVVDGVMPGVDGLAVVQRLRTDVLLRAIPCLFVTGSEDRTLESRAFESGADAFLHKSQDPALLLAELGALIRSRRPPVIETAAAGLFGAKKLIAIGVDGAYFTALGAQLREEQWEVVVTKSIEQAQELLKVECVDCLIVEEALLGKTRDSAVKAMLEQRGVPLMVLADYANDQVLRDTLSAGADDLLLKSRDFSTIKAQLRNRLLRRQIEDERHHAHQTQKLHAEVRAIKELAHTRDASIAELERRNAELAAVLSSIDAVTGSLLDAKLTDEQMQLVRKLKQSADALRNIIDEIQAVFNQMGRNAGGAAVAPIPTTGQS